MGLTPSLGVGASTCPPRHSRERTIMATVATDPITMKLDQMFAATDTDSDGYVDWSDYQRLVDRY
ncbi:EF-hand domain-containing protein [Streptomyces sp. CC53]|uniref:EF-hand domain-containing protein n=1 Tax=Streptomyces sp. CC53 TaxID=1906740 RepID=UPI00115FF3FE|nr:EF-hand domain-containing protein [Streptomyces sp. CC53]